MIRTIIVDDEPPARRKIARFLSKEREFTVLAEAGSGAEAIGAVNRLKPDLLFLDISLPDRSGFEVLESIEDRTSLYTVFITARDDFAVKAFEVHALDYLLKPVEPSRFVQTLQRIQDVIASKRTHELAGRLEHLIGSLRPQLTYPRRLLVPEGNRSIFLDVDRIDWLEAARNYVCVHSGGQTSIIRSSLDALVRKLDPARFRRINRSEVVNVERISEIRSWFHGDQKIRLQDGTELTWSRRYRTGTLDEFEQA
jgi:two-component system LytT family response regulator